MNLDVTLIVTVVGFALSVGTFFVGRQSAAKSAGRENGAVLTRLDSIDEKMGKIDLSLGSVNTQLGEQRDRITRIETKMELYHGGGMYEA